MRELLAWDAEAAFPVLKAMAEDDPHPDVRNAARRTISEFFQDEALPTAPETGPSA
jgi:hypothetical protein